MRSETVSVHQVLQGPRQYLVPFYAWLTDGSGRSPQHIAEIILRGPRLVPISLDVDDDTQVISKARNGRGAELHATDLICNFTFMRADKDHADGFGGSHALEEIGIDHDRRIVGGAIGRLCS